MNSLQKFYLCPICFHATETRSDTHEKSHGLMMEYNGYPLGHTQLKPIQNQNGTLKSTMPRWMTQTSRRSLQPAF